MSVRLYKLRLRCKFVPHLGCSDVCYGTLDELRDFVDSEKTTRYTGGGVVWLFRKGGPLEHYELPDERPPDEEYYMPLECTLPSLAEFRQGLPAGDTDVPSAIREGRL